MTTSDVPKTLHVEICSVSLQAGVMTVFSWFPYASCLLLLFVSVQDEVYRSASSDCSCLLLCWSPPANHLIRSTWSPQYLSPGSCLGVELSAVSGANIDFACLSLTRSPVTRSLTVFSRQPHPGGLWVFWFVSSPLCSMTRVSCCILFWLK